MRLFANNQDNLTDFIKLDVDLIVLTAFSALSTYLATFEVTNNKNIAQLSAVGAGAFVFLLAEVVRNCMVQTFRAVNANEPQVDRKIRPL